MFGVCFRGGSVRIRLLFFALLLIALLAGEPDIRQVIAFPKVSSGSDPLTGAPTPMPDDVLRELGVRALPPDDPRPG